MSSLPLISHHLFVAAVKDRNCAPRVPGGIRPALASTEVRVEEIPAELLDPARVLPLQVVSPPDAFPWTAST